jgi:hypothetical protein
MAFPFMVRHLTMNGNAASYRDFGSADFWPWSIITVIPPQFLHETGLQNSSEPFQLPRHVTEQFFEYQSEAPFHVGQYRIISPLNHLSISSEPPAANTDIIG